MMQRRSLLLGAGLVLAAGCASTPPPGGGAVIWLDREHEYDPARVTVTRRKLFELDPALVARLRAEGIADAHRGTRSAHLMAVIFGPDLKAFSYAGGHSTVAAETWRNKQGDCLSLTVLAFALARELDIPLQMQEVRVPVTFDRRGGVDFLNNHVNALLRADRPLRVGNQTLPSGEIIIDFQPQVGSRQRGTALNEQAMLARYLNNIGAEQFSLGDGRAAYAHFKAAVQAEAGYAPAYANLAQLYLRGGYAAAAETALRHALQLDPGSDLSLSALHQLLLAQGRRAEAAQYEKLVQARRAQDPYYWLGLGIERLQQQQPLQAIDALERAQALASGFEEIHRYLSIAYWQAGRTLQARDQLARLRAIDQGHPSLAKLTRKFTADTALQ